MATRFSDKSSLKLSLHDDYCVFNATQSIYDAKAPDDCVQMTFAIGKLRSNDDEILKSLFSSNFEFHFPSVCFSNA